MKQTLILQEGSSVLEIDESIEQFGLPMGPFVLADEVGIDIGFHVATILEKAYGERMKVAGIFYQMFTEEKLLGKKSGAGFYQHSPKSARRYNKNIDTILTFYRSENEIDVQIFTAQQIVDRCILIMVNEATRCLQEGIVKNPAYLDMAMIMGTGFPAFQGGLLKYADNQGLTNICTKLSQLAKQYGQRFQPTTLLLDKAQAQQTFYEGEKMTKQTQPSHEPDHKQSNKDNITVIDTSKMNADKVASINLTEVARDSHLHQTGFAGQLFMGTCQMDAIFPFPTQSSDEQKVGDELVAKVCDFLVKHLDAEQVDATQTIPDSVIQGLIEMGLFAMKVPKNITA
ncbi:3-hydroxyacyl-CoA dehydrogenase family protein [Psychromonas sp. KJ10-10]|uniref:3-hydroxyacyl-CoA dehydrogenase family protein n=1 Tax=Psychromonas sp. KJ10-10 TaxID=3391823 RepID=UPI0039B414F1